jgi:hypothetical protein
MVAVGLLTYIIVFNLNHIVKAGKEHYQHLKSNTIERMRADKRKSWKETGDLFNRHKPKINTDKPKPSEWWVLVYQIHRLLHLVRYEIKEENPSVDQEPTKESTQVRQGKWYTRLLRKRDKKQTNEPAVELDLSTSDLSSEVVIVVDE